MGHGTFRYAAALQIHRVGRRGGGPFGFTIVLAVVAAALTVVGQAAPAVAVPELMECRDTLFIGARGSGQPSDGDSTDGWTGFGAQVNSAHRSIEAFLAPRTMVSVPVNYPAHDVVSIFDWDRYFQGLQAGVEETERILELRGPSCPEERIILAGYSQGAMVMHRVMQRMTEDHHAYDRIAGVLLIADGDRLPLDRTVEHGSALPFSRGVGQWYPVQSGASSEMFAAGFGRAHSVCNLGDVVCDHPGYLNGQAIHGRYTDTEELRRAARAIGETAMRWATPVPKDQAMKATVGLPLRRQLEVSVEGVTDPVEWMLVTPLPPGVNLSATGVLSGTPSESGTFHTTYRVRAPQERPYGDWITGTVTWDVAPPGTGPTLTTEVSTSWSNESGDGGSAFPSVSADGRVVAFESFASNLVAGDTNGDLDVYVRDLGTAEMVRVSVAHHGGQADGGAGSPSLSSDGRFVAFESWASDLVPDDTNGTWDVFVRDLTSSTTTRVSVSSEGEAGNAASFQPSISADGRYVAFTSLAGNLVTGDTNSPMHASSDVFVHDRVTGETTRVSVTSDGREASGSSHQPSISGDGRYVAFQSGANDLVADDTNWLDVFVHDRDAKTTKLVSVSSDGIQGNDYATEPKFSHDGRYVFFQSDADNLVADDNNGIDDIFAHDLVSGETTRETLTSDGAELVGGFQHGAAEVTVGSDGRFIAFVSDAENLPNHLPGSPQVYLRDRATGTVELVVDTDSGGHPYTGASQPHLSADGRYLVLSASRDSGNLPWQVFLHDRGA